MEEDQDLGLRDPRNDVIIQEGSLLFQSKTEKTEMKILGHTPDGGTIVEFDQEESSTLQAAASALEGRQHFEHCIMVNQRQLRPFDVKKLFKSLELWLRLMFNVNGLRVAVQMTEEALCVKGEERAPQS